MWRPPAAAAVEGPHPLRILYQALHAEQPVPRVVRPYGMAYRGTALYLIGFCELREEIRIFRANRILEAQVLSSTFERPADFDLEQYLSDVWGIEFGPLMHVRVRFDRSVARLVRETVWHPSQRVEEEEGGSVILRMEARGTGELAALAGRLRRRRGGAGAARAAGGRHRTGQGHRGEVCSDVGFGLL